ncbi:uncharacterized protein LOC129573895 isoform X2 [Sitodiplosis mosellana]|uniref:uncharacterized protein LOC129573895 isoform X2 n=1 Tax=Sitodiplosis mosellana TaxID=263140 RepID=UPI00244401A5|nr:uncharacterized protein LOC129573895 isoform X2 [Sitodiplosis mosellana]XP_055311023.1 uncharacterized protein LOC129573895 isoform X2 [Sitodiplosis mosellana]XP_055311026.1 uncharacterized protein LOC129573895 isoform X2 [Sitodiplosis mosellana]XP_055311027.1 uncharacterized protein LOC129573895 isoform X2 [Sitodiplosis mosellana]
MSSKVLVIGAGRIGAEALEYIAACGFDDIQIIDMESKDVKHLGEQFVEMPYSVGKPRAELIRESIPNIQLKVTNYGYSFFQQFHLILNALDNRLDRDHVSAMCECANVPVIDCYECAAQEPIPSETIQNTPPNSTDCLAWSIHVFHQIFGREVIDKIRLVQMDGSKVLSSLLKVLSQTANSCDEKIRQLVETSNCNAQLLFKHLFGEDIKDTSDSLETNLTGIDQMAKQVQMDPIRLESAAVDFVTAATNLRATVHGIPRKSRLEIKFVLTLTLDEPGLFDMPNEVLNCIFDCFNDETLLAASRTCKRFQSIAAKTFERKYANQPYKVRNLEIINYQQMHRAVLINFGATFTDIEVADADLTDEHRWLIEVLKENVATLKKVKFATEWEAADINLGEVFLFFPNLTHLSLDGYAIEDDNWSHIHMPYLKHLAFYSMDYVEEECFDRFFDNNRQIESLVYQDTTNNFLESINNRLNQLKMLQVPEFFFEPTPIHLKSLEKLKLTENSEEMCILDAFSNGCKNIKELSVVFVEGVELDEKYISTIASFEKIESLEIEDTEITIDEIKLIERQIPHLKSFSVITEIETEDDDDDDHQLIVDEILSMVSSTKILTKLELAIDLKCPKRFDADFHARFLEAIGVHRPDFMLLLELEGQRHHSINLMVTKNCITSATCDTAPVIVHVVDSSSPINTNS